MTIARWVDSALRAGDNPRVATVPDVELLTVGYDHPDVALLTEQAQHLYLRLYGGHDDSPVAVDEFAAPRGGFVVAYDTDRPVAMGGWRLVPPVPPLPGRRPAEIKRMFVAPDRRRRGLARTVLAHLETGAASGGADWMVLETGVPQVEAIVLYRDCGYADVAKFGHYADSPLSVSLGKPLRTRRPR
ncbi:MAG: GNAT family N-acetyltransferase [Nocardioidaceae bacterium]